MDVTYLQVKNFRNIEKCELEPCDSVNIIYGQFVILTSQTCTLIYSFLYSTRQI